MCFLLCTLSRCVDSAQIAGKFVPSRSEISNICLHIKLSHFYAAVFFCFFPEKYSLFYCVLSRLLVASTNPAVVNIKPAFLNKGMTTRGVPLWFKSHFKLGFIYHLTRVFTLLQPPTRSPTPCDTGSCGGDFRAPAEYIHFHNGLVCIRDKHRRRF